MSIVIPNYNGISYLEGCLKSIQEQKNIHPEVMVVDNGSTDGSQDYIKKEFPFCKLICLDQNYGFCRAVNEGFQAAESEYVILLNNDTEVKPDFSRKLLDAIRADQRRFSCQACMLQYQNPELTDAYGIMQAPTLVLVKNGEISKFVNASNIKKYVDSRRH